MRNFYTLLSAMVLIFVSVGAYSQDITGFCWEDSNGNGLQDTGEPVLTGINVILQDNVGNPTGLSGVTDGLGMYTITGASVGTSYRLQFDISPLGVAYEATQRDVNANGSDMIDSDITQAGLTFGPFTLAAAGIDVDAGFYETVSIGDLVWLDDNGNGDEDDGQLSLPGTVAVSLQRETPAGSGTWVAATQFDGTALPAINTSDAYDFNMLAPGTYRVTFGTTATLRLTYQGATTQAGDGSNTDSNADRMTGQSYPITLVSGDGNYEFVDAGYFGPTSVSGIVWLDDNGDGMDNEGGAALTSTVDVTLQYFDPIGGAWVQATTRFDGTPIPNNPTNTSNLYSFTNLPPGQYRVEFEEPGGADLHLTTAHVNDGGAWPGDDTDDSDADQTAPHRSHEFETTMADPMIIDVDAGYYVPIRIGNFVFEDSNGDGDQAGELGLAGITVRLIRNDLGGPAVDPDGNPIADIVTPGSGLYEFFPMPPGDYTVEFEWTEPTFYVTYMDAVADADDSDVADCNAGGTPGMGQVNVGQMNSSDEDVTVDAGFFEAVRISDQVWEDDNANGIQDGEPDLPGVTVEILDGTGAPLDAMDFADCNVINSVVTDGAGMYEFTNLRPGDYIIRFVPLTAPSQYYITLKDAGGDAVDSDADEVTGETDPIIGLLSGDDIDNVDCGMFRAASVGRTGWHDLNGDGLLSGEPPVDDGVVTVEILNMVTGLEPNDLTTGAPVGIRPIVGGDYVFDNIPPGEYQLTFNILNADWFLTRENQAGTADDAGDVDDDSDPQELNGNATHRVVLTSGEENEWIDAGFFKAACVEGEIWHDENANGIRGDDGTLPTPPGARVVVRDNITGGTANDIGGNPAIFDLGGNNMYEFCMNRGLKPGSYTLFLDLPAGWFVSPLGDNVFDPGTQLTMTLDLESDQTESNVDGGIFKNITVGGFLWGEQNGDCMFQQGTENGYGMVTVNLFDDGGSQVQTTTTDAMGGYMFMDVRPGDYTIEIPADQFDTGGPLANLKICGGAEDPNNDTPFDNNGNGPASGGPIMTPVIELRCGREPGGDGTENKTIDIGFEFDCNSANNPFAQVNCENAALNPICNLNILLTGCGTMPGAGSNQATGPSPLCSSGQPHNTSWFSFIAGYGDYDIFIELFACTPGTGGEIGVQAGMAGYDPNNAPPCWQTDEIVFCNDGLNPPPGILIPGDDLIPGNQYIMWLDGFSFSICGYAFDIQGDYEPFKVREPEQMLCDGEPDCGLLCPNIEREFTVLDVFDTDLGDHGYNVISNLIFGWSLRDASGNIIEDFNTNPNDFETGENKIIIEFPTPGVYQVCLEQVRDVCLNVVEQQICIDVEVVELEDEDFGTVEICNDEIILYQGPTEDETGNPDPNDDTTLGWQSPGFFFTGGQENIAMITTPEGCMYEQKVYIEPIFNSFATIDTAICGASGFPVTFADFPISGAVENIMWTAFDQADNGCDSVMTITALNYEIDGDVELVGCAPGGGFEIQFVEASSSLGLISLPQNQPAISYQWTNAAGDVIPFDPANPYTAIVPSAGEYTLCIYLAPQFPFLNEDTQYQCEYCFTRNINPGNLAPPDPTASNWPVAFCENNDIATYFGETSLDPAEIVTYNWTVTPATATVLAGGSGAPGVGADSIRIDWNGASQGIVCFSITNDCAESMKVCETIEVTPLPVAVIDPVDEICADSVTTVSFGGTPDGAFTYSWNFGGGNPIGTTNNAGPIQVSWADPGTKQVTLRVSKNGCLSNVDTVTVEVVAPETPPIITCDSTATDLVVFTWDFPGALNFVPTITSGPTGATGALNGNQYTVTGLTVGDVVSISLLTDIDSPCDDLISVHSCQARNCPSLDITIDPVDPICFDASTAPINLNAVISGGATGTYTWSGPGTTADGVFTPQNANSGNNNITVQFVDAATTCDYSNGITIRVNETPTADFDVDRQVICEDSVTTVVYTGNVATGGTFNWTFGDVLLPGNSRGPFDLQWLTPGEKEVLLFVTRQGCPSDTVRYPVTVEPRIEPIDIDCDEEATSINFSWNNLPNVDDYTVTIQVLGSTDPPIVLNNTDSLSYLLSGLIPETEVEITVQANSANSCEGTNASQVCQAVNCPPFDIRLTRDTTICLFPNSANIQLSALVTGGPGLGGAYGRWRGPGVDSITGVFNPNIAGLSTGNGHRITYEHYEANCEDFKRMFIRVIQQPTADFTIVPVICVTDTMTITYGGNSPTLPFDWNIQGATATQVNANTYRVKWNTAGTYDLSLQVGNTGCKSDIETQTVQVDPEMDTVAISCTSTLNSVTFTWNDIDCASEYQVLANNLAIGTSSNLSYTATGLNEGDQVTIRITPQAECECPAEVSQLTCQARACPPVVLDLSAPNPTFCLGEVVSPFNMIAEISGSIAQGSGEWTGQGVNAQGSFNPNGLTAGLYPLTFTYTESGCTFEESVTIEIFENPTVTAVSTDPICYQQNFGSAVLTPQGGNGNYTYFVNGNEVTGANVSNLSPANYTVLIQDQNGCEATTSFNIQDAIAAQLALNGNTVIQLGNSGQLQVNVTQIDGTVDSIVWTVDGQVICSGIDCGNVTVSPDEDSEYCARVYYNDGCFVDECIDVRVVKKDVIVLPNVIKINGSTGTNNTFYVSDEYSTVLSVKSMKIYDRWGELMFTVKNVPPGPANGWNGLFNGKQVTPGVYVYVVELEIDNGQVLQLTGDVTVLE